SVSWLAERCDGDATQGRHAFRLPQRSCVRWTQEGRAAHADSDYRDGLGALAESESRYGGLRDGAQISAAIDSCHATGRIAQDPAGAGRTARCGGPRLRIDDRSFEPGLAAEIIRETARDPNGFVRRLEGGDPVGRAHRDGGGLCP